MRLVKISDQPNLSFILMLYLIGPVEIYTEKHNECALPKQIVGRVKLSP